MNASQSQIAYQGYSFKTSAAKKYRTLLNRWASFSDAMCKKPRYKGITSLEMVSKASLICKGQWLAANRRPPIICSLHSVPWARVLLRAEQGLSMELIAANSRPWRPAKFIVGETRGYLTWDVGFATFGMRFRPWPEACGSRLRMWLKTYEPGQRTFTEKFEYPELPVPVAARIVASIAIDLTTCIACDQCAKACPVDCIYIGKERVTSGKGFQVPGFTIDYSKCMFCAFCVEPCPVDCIFMGASHDFGLLQPRWLHRRFFTLAGRSGLGPSDTESDSSGRFQGACGAGARRPESVEH